MPVGTESPQRILAPLTAGKPAYTVPDGKMLEAVDVALSKASTMNCTNSPEPRPFKVPDQMPSPASASPPAPSSRMATEEKAAVSTVRKRKLTELSPSGSETRAVTTTGSPAAGTAGV